MEFAKIISRSLTAGMCVAAAVAAVLAGGNVARADDAPADPYDGKLQVSFTPYIWLPTLNSTFRYSFSKLPSILDGVPVVIGKAHTFDTQIGPNSYLAKINFALMGNAQIRKGNAALYLDALNANISGAGGSIQNITGPRGNLNATFSSHSQTQAVSTLYTIAPSYTVYRPSYATIDILVGGRFLNVSTNAGFQLTGPFGNTHSVGVSQSANQGNLIIGTYGHFDLAKHLTVPFYLDGGLGNPSTWQAIAGLKYGNLSFAWRFIEYNTSVSDALIQSLSLGGPLVGYTIRL